MMVLTSCARPDWGETLQGNEMDSGRRLLAAMAATEGKCPRCRDADINLTLKSPLQDAAASGYLLWRRPSWIKFVSSNPFGQPLLLVTSDGVRFQQLLMPRQTYLHGRIFSYLAHNNLPVALAVGDWGSWLSGGVGHVKVEEVEVRPDLQHRGLWFVWPLPFLPGAPSVKGEGFQEHVLVDAANQLVITRIISDEREKTVVRFDYNDRQGSDICQQPEKITISDLAGGGVIEIVFSDLQTPAQCPDDLFRLQKPENFQELYMP